MKSLDRKAILAVAVAVASMTTLAACNTVRGAGEDVTTAGHAVSNTATDVQQDMKNK